MKVPAKNYPERPYNLRPNLGLSSDFRSDHHSPTLTFNTANWPHHPLASHRQGSPHNSFSFHSCVSSCGEYWGEDSIPVSQVFSHSHRLSCWKMKQKLIWEPWHPAGRQLKSCIQELPDPSEAEVISKTRACVNPLSLWGTGKAHTGDPEAVE